MNPLFFASDGTYWFAPPGTEFAKEVIWTFNFILWVSIVFFVLIVGLCGYFVVKYRRRDGVDPEPSPHHSTLLEISWSIVPVILCMMMFWSGFKTYMKMTTPPANTYDIQVEAQKWSFGYTYPNGTFSKELHVPKGENIRLILNSKDVLHSFFIPDFGVKMDVVPGRFNTMWFNAPEVNEHIVFCAEYCGSDHSDMISKVVVQDRADFEAWLEEEGNYVDRMSPVEAGAYTYDIYGCSQCHSIDGSKGTGPSFKGVWTWGQSRALEGGDSVTVDENYIRESVLKPKAMIASGYEGVMPSFNGQLNDKKILALIAFLKDVNGVPQ
ncbi:MAG: cytochrome c oxidase subunit II [Planctomycetota bacterium]